MRPFFLLFAYTYSTINNLDHNIVCNPKTIGFQASFIVWFTLYDLRDKAKITSPFVHLIFRPSLPDLQTQNPQNSSTIPAVLRFQIEQI